MNVDDETKEQTFCSVLQNTVFRLCQENYGTEFPDWEIDGVICISVPSSKEQHVVKLHQKFLSDSLKNINDFDDSCYTCHKKQDNLSKERSKRSYEEVSKTDYNESVKDEETSYRNVSVIDLEHASALPDPTQPCGQGTTLRNNKSPVQDKEQDSHFFATSDLVEFVQRNGPVSDLNKQSHVRRSYRVAKQDHSSKFSSGSKEIAPFQEKPESPLDDFILIKEESLDGETFECGRKERDRAQSKEETNRRINHNHTVSPSRNPSETIQTTKKDSLPGELVVVKAELDNEEEFACISESVNVTEIEEDTEGQEDAAEKTPADINYLFNGSSNNHYEYGSQERIWPQLHLDSAGSSQRDAPPVSGSHQFPQAMNVRFTPDTEEMNINTRSQRRVGFAEQTDNYIPGLNNTPKATELDHRTSFSSASTTDFPSQNLCINSRAWQIQLPINSGYDAADVQTLVNGNKLRPRRKYTKKGQMCKIAGLNPSNKQFLCRFCGLAFTKRCNQLRHEQTICGTTLYKCKVCPTVFRRADNRTRHMINRHGIRC